MPRKCRGSLMPAPAGLTAAAHCDKTGLDSSNDPGPNPGVCPGVKNDQKAQELKNEFGRSLICLSQHSHVAMANQPNCRTACIEMLEKISFYQQKSWFFSRCFFQSFQLLPKKCQSVFSVKIMQLFHIQQFPIKDSWDLGVWGV